jgi:hypothetical protein
VSIPTVTPYEFLSIEHMRADEIDLDTIAVVLFDKEPLFSDPPKQVVFGRDGLSDVGARGIAADTTATGPRPPAGPEAVLTKAVTADIL